MSVRLLFPFFVLLFSNLSFAVTEDQIEINFGESKQYQSLGEARSYALHGGELLSDILLHANFAS